MTQRLGHVNYFVMSQALSPPLHSSCLPLCPALFCEKRGKSKSQLSFRQRCRQRTVSVKNRNYAGSCKYRFGDAILVESRGSSVVSIKQPLPLSRAGGWFQCWVDTGPWRCFTQPVVSCANYDLDHAQSCENKSGQHRGSETTAERDLCPQPTPIPPAPAPERERERERERENYSVILMYFDCFN